MKNRGLKSGLVTLSVCLVFLLLAGNALAITIKMSVEELTNEATTIIRGTVLDLRSHWNKERTHIVTDVTISAQEYIKGYEGGEIIIQVPGGTVGELGEWVEDVPTFEKGQEVILFLGDNEYFRAVGWHQGKFTVEKDTVLEIGLPVDTFMAGIRQTITGSPPRWAVEKFPEVSTQGEIGALALDSISPTSGPAHADELGGIGCASDSTSVTFYGSGWPSSRGANDDAKFFYQGGSYIDGCVDSWSSTQIAARVPARASSGNARIYLNGVSDGLGLPFEVTYSYGGGKWPAGSYPQPMSEEYRINENTSDCSGEGAAVQAADTTWDNVASADFYFRYGGTTTATDLGYNGVNEVMWRNLGTTNPLATCYTVWYTSNPAEIIEFDIRFNDYNTWSTTGAAGTFDIQSIATHELGHALALLDLYGSADSEKTMYGYSSTGETKLRTLEPEDVAGISYIYPGSGNNPPNAPTNPSPADGATGVSINADLSWTGGDPDPGDTVTYDVYFEANDSTPDNLICNNVATPTCDPGTLAYNTPYYWYVVATDNHSASTTGGTWDFTTESTSGCGDTYEPDDSYASARSITVNGAAQTHNFHEAGDEDWVEFTVTAGEAYTMTTLNLGASADTVLELYDTNGTTQLRNNDDCPGGGRASCINNWSDSDSGTYFIKVRQWGGTGGCTGYNYDLRVVGGSGVKVYLPIVLKSSASPSFEDQLISLINAERSSRSLGTLSQSGILMQVAEAHSQDMVDRNFFSHVNPDGLGPGERLTNAGYNWSTWGETIGAGYSTPQAMFDGWMNSSDHRAILLSEAYTEIGIGYVAGGTYGHYWTAVFAKPW